MKLRSSILLSAMAVVAMSAQAHAQTSSIARPRQSQSNSYNEHGLRVGLVLPVLSRYGRVTKEESSDPSLQNLDGAFGLSLGYANLPVRRLGYLGGVTYLEASDGSSSNGLARLDTNIGFALDEQLYGKGGLNVTRWTRGYLSTFDLVMGFQGGIGYRFNRYLGLEAGYTVMKQQSPDAGVLSVEGGELSLNGTF